MKKEKEYNQKMMTNYQGDLITYGSSIQLLHSDSKMFIAGEFESPNKEKYGYNCEMSDYYKSGMVFKIYSKYKSTDEGDNIQYKDHVIFYSVDSYANGTLTKQN